MTDKPLVAQGPSPERSVPRSQAPNQPRSEFRRQLEDNRAYLITTNTHERQALFHNRRLAQIIVDNVCFYRDRGDFSLHAYVVMPDHIHLLLTPGAIQISDIMRNIKSFAAKQIREMLSLGGPIWQSRFHDRAIRSENQFSSAIQYIHENPVKAGFVIKSEDYEFSSSRAFTGQSGVSLGIDMPDGSRLGP